MTGRSCYHNRTFERGHEEPADRWDSLFLTPSGARRIRNHNHLDLSGASRSVALLARSDSLGEGFRLMIGAPHVKGRPFSALAVQQSRSQTAVVWGRDYSSSAVTVQEYYKSQKVF